jgi:hypothetical protein
MFLSYVGWGEDRLGSWKQVVPMGGEGGIYIRLNGGFHGNSTGNV